MPNVRQSVKFALRKFSLAPHFVCWLMGKWEEESDPRKGNIALAKKIAEGKGIRVRIPDTGGEAPAERCGLEKDVASGLSRAEPLLVRVYCDIELLSLENLKALEKAIRLLLVKREKVEKGRKS